MPNSASTFGWDTVSAIRIRDVNRVLAATQPPPFPQEFSIQRTPTLSFQGKLGTWQMTSGGSQDMVRFKIPYHDVTFTHNAETHPVVDGAFVIEVRLTFVPHTDVNPETVNGTLHNLVVSATGQEELPPVRVVLVEHEQPLDHSVEAVLKGALGDWFSANIAEFAHIFAVVNLDRKAAQGQFSFVLPTFSRYAYAEHPNTPDDSVLGILSMTEGRSDAGLISQVAVTAIPDDQHAGILISKQRLLDSLIRPALPSLFKNSTAEDFGLSDDHSAVILKKEFVQLPDRTDDNGDTHEVFLRQFSVTLDGEILTTHAVIGTTIRDGVEGRTLNTSFALLTLKDMPDGKQTLAFVKAKEPINENVVVNSVGELVAEVVTQQILTLLGTAAAVVFEGIDLVLVLVLIAVAEGEVRNLGDTDLQSIGTPPALDLLVLNVTDPILWADTKDFKLTFAGLADSLQLAGTVQAAAAANA